MDPVVRYALLAAACVLSGVVAILIINYKRVQDRRDVRLSREEVLRRLFTRKIDALGNEAGTTDMRQMVKKLKKITKDFFGELFEINREFDYVELNEVLGKKGVDEAMRKQVIDFSMRIDEFEYSGRPITEEELLSLVDSSVGIIRNVTEKKEEADIESLRKEVSEMQKSPETQEPRSEPESALKIKISGIVSKHRGKGEPKAAPQMPPEKKDVPKPAEKVVDKPKAVPAPAKPEETIPEPEEEKPAAEAPKDEPEETKPSKEHAAGIEKIRKLLLLSEQSVEMGRHEDAMDDYLELRRMYDSLPSEVKIGIQEETKRIIALYNSLLKEYKDTLSKIG